MVVCIEISIAAAGGRDKQLPMRYVWLHLELVNLIFIFKIFGNYWPGPTVPKYGLKCVSFLV
jgi:hypothetical protein